jgi:SAM-dependent methyltransferase
MRTMARNIRHSSNHDKIDLMYMMPDPWQMSSPTEEFRFLAINGIIEENFGRVGSILEIGCGEGHQTVHLRRVSDGVIGLDVSPRAIARAREKQPDGRFMAGTVFSPEVDVYGPFDLVVASEVLYYMSDIQAVLRRMREIGRANLVTYFSDEWSNLDPEVLSIFGAKSKVVEFGDAQWRAVWWRND